MKSSAIDYRGVILLVSASHHNPPMLRDLEDSEVVTKILSELEGETSARLIAERGGGLAQSPRDLAFARRTNV